MATATQTQARPGSLFGLPGFTRPYEIIENNDGIVTTLSQTALAPVTGLIPFRQSDIVECWLMETTIANTVTAGTQTIKQSAYFPDNFIGPLNLTMQNQFNTISVESGIDLALFQLIRPYRYATDSRNMLYASPASGYSAEANLVSSGSYTNASTSIKRTYQLPGGQWFDQFHPLDAQGNIVGPPVPTFVSPQYMAGTARLVTPQITFNPAFPTTTDNGPYNVSGSTSTPATFSGTNTLNLKRIGYYQPARQDGADSPVLWNWQYTRKTQRYSLSGLSKANLQVPVNGQILSLYVRLFDPAATWQSVTSAGAPIALSNVTECDVTYGPGLFRYQDRPVEMQSRFFEQHDELLPIGVMAWDFAIDPRGRITNQYALNTLNTSSIQIQLQFSGTLSSTAYAVMGVEALTYVQAG